MTRSHSYSTHSYPTLRRQLVLWLAIFVAMAGPALAASTIAAQAALPGHTAAGAFTRFEIDGGLGGADDWAGGGYGPHTTAQGRRSVGIVDLVEGTDACHQDPDDGYTGSIDGAPYSWPTTDESEPNDKTDICNIGVAYEVVEVAGQYHWVLYHYVARSGDATGDMSTVVILDRVGQVEDTLIEFDFSPSSGTAPRKHVWNGTDWIASGLDSGFEVAVGASPFEPGANEGTFVELAVDLTANGLLPPAGAGDEVECGPFTVAGAASFTGNDANSSLKDRADFSEPISLSSCTDLLVAKEATPAEVSSSATFTYLVDQADGQPSHNGTLEATGGGEDVDGTDASITSPIRVGEAHTWTNVLAAPDYRLDELSLPDGWSLHGAECTWYDPFAGTTRTEVVADASGVLQTFQVPPRGLDGGTPTACTITNATSGLVIAKAGTGDPAAQFTFEVTGKDDQVLSLGESSAMLAFEPGTAVTLAESLPAQAPAWQARGVECRDGDGTVVATGAEGGVEVTTVGGEVVTCTFTNVQQAGLVVAKTGAPAGSDQPFGFDWDVTDALDGAADFQLQIDGEPQASGDVAPGTYTVTELLEATNPTADPDFTLGDVACAITTPGSESSSWTTSLLDAEAVVTLAAGDVVTCTFTNVQAGRLVVDKETDGHDGTFTFSGAVEGTITTVDGATPVGEALVVDLPAGTHDVTEAVPAGWDLAAASCDDGSGTATIDEEAGALAGIEVGHGEIVTCTFVNEVETATLTLTKDWGETAEPGDAVTLAATGDDPATAGPATGGSTAPDTHDDAALTIHAGEQVVLEETHDDGNAGGYETFLACDPADAGTLAHADGATTGTFTVPADDPRDVTCTFLNERRTAELTLRKQWIAGHAGDSAMLAAAGVDEATATSTATGGDEGHDIATVEVLSGEVVDLVEELDADNVGTYATSLSCTDPDGLAWEEGDLVGSYTVPAVPADVTCTFTNVRTSTQLTLSKTWQDPVAGDAVDLSVVGEAGEGAGRNAGDASVAIDATLTVYSGEVVTLSEAFAPGEAEWYDTGLACDGGDLDHVDDADTATLTVTATHEPITCVFENARATAAIVLAKDVAPDTDPGVFDLYVDGELVVDDGGDGATSEPVTVLVGDAVTVGEMAGTATDAAGYAAELACEGAEPSSNTGTTGVLTVSPAAADETITCTFTNSRRSATLTLTKDWIDGADGDAVELDAAGDSRNSAPATGSSVAPGADSDAALTVWAGEAVTMAERLGVDNVGSYDAALACTDPDGLTWAAGALSGTYRVPAEPVDVTCTFTNTRTRVNLVLEKEWVDAAVDDVATLSFDGEVAAPSGRSTATGAAGAELDTPVVMGEVLSGETVAIAESLDDANDAVYTTSLACDGGELHHDPGELDADVAIPSDAARDVTCRFTNAATPGRVEADLAVAKTGTAAVTLPPEGGSATIAYEVAVTNHGPDAATDVVVTDTLPAQVALEAVTPALGACAATPEGFACELGTMAAGDVVIIEVTTTTVAGVAAGDVVNVAQVSSSTPDPDRSNDRDDHATSIARALPRTGADLRWLGMLALLMTLAGAAVRWLGRTMAGERTRLPGS